MKIRKKKIYENRKKIPQKTENIPKKYHIKQNKILNKEASLNYKLFMCMFTVQRGSHTYPLQRDDVLVSQLVAGHGIDHVLSDQLLHTLLSHHGAAEQDRDGRVSQNATSRGRRAGIGGVTHEGRRTAQGTLLPRTSLVTAHTYLSWERGRNNSIDT